MKVMYSEILDELIIVLEQRRNFLLMETRHLKTFELNGVFANIFLKECGYETIGKL